MMHSFLKIQFKNKEKAALECTSKCHSNRVGGVAYTCQNICHTISLKSFSTNLYRHTVSFADREMVLYISSNFIVLHSCWNELPQTSVQYIWHFYYGRIFFFVIWKRLSAHCIHYSLDHLQKVYELNSCTSAIRIHNLFSSDLLFTHFVFLYADKESEVWETRISKQIKILLFTTCFQLVLVQCLCWPLLLQYSHSYWLGNGKKEL